MTNKKQLTKQVKNGFENRIKNVVFLQYHRALFCCTFYSAAASSHDHSFVKARVVAGCEAAPGENPAR